MELKPVKNFENKYLISSCGKLFNTSLKEITPKDNLRGYMVYTSKRNSDNSNQVAQSSG